MPMLNLPPVPKHLLSDPWTEDDEALVHFTFHNNLSAQRDADIEYHQAKMKILTQCCSTHVFCPVYAIFCLPYQVLSLDKQKEAMAHNAVQNRYKRYVALGRNGILYKTVEIRPMGTMPGNCEDDCCCIYDTHDVLRKPASSKTIPFEKIQDVRVQDASGAQVVGCCDCCLTESFPYVDSKTMVDTSGRGIELNLSGLENPKFFKKCVLAMKNGRELPALEGQKGVYSHFQDLKKVDTRSHQIALMEGKSRGRSIDAPAPADIEMTRKGNTPSTYQRKAGDSRGDYTELIAAIEVQSGILREHTALLQQIVDKH